MNKENINLMNINKAFEEGAKAKAKEIFKAMDKIIKGKEWVTELPLDVRYVWKSEYEELKQKHEVRNE